ncbi:c-type cytochrome [Candidatus Burkholderia verschuerenii]|uniref:c-type cytochrome n=1 Tax=Candidatus Burkholderia verschuerenii TaxID=242163 RepID=UPI000A3FF4E6|nr:c-type cytochrome [Candidatus Burkholderia verschuerenii]
MIAGMSMLTCIAASAQTPDSAVGDAIAHQGVPPAVPACIACHGAHGEGNAQAGFPRLAGLSAGYLAAQLNDFASGARQQPVMMPIAKGMTPEARANVAAYFASLDAPSSASSTSTQKPDALGEQLALHGNWKSGVPACVSCYGDQGSGVGDAFPALASQPAAYIKTQLAAWKAGTRAPGPLGLMSAVAKRLSDQEADAAATYFASLPAAAHNAQESAKQGVAR